MVIVYSPGGVVGWPGTAITDDPQPTQLIVSSSIATAGATRASLVCGANFRTTASPSSDSSHSTTTWGGIIGGMLIGLCGASDVMQFVRSVTTRVIGAVPFSVPLDGVTAQIVVGGFPEHANVTGPTEPADGFSITVNCAVLPPVIVTCVPVPAAGVNVKLVVGVNPVPVNGSTVGLPV